MMLLRMWFYMIYFSSGTCRKHVYQDYMARLAQAISNAKNVQRQMISVILSSDNPKAPASTQLVHEVTTDPIKEGTEYSIVVQNSLSHKRTAIIKIRSSTAGVKLYDPDGVAVVYQTYPLLDSKNGDIHEILFPATVDGFAILKYTISCAASSTVAKQTRNVEYTQDGRSRHDFMSVNTLSNNVKISNPHYDIYFDANTGYISRVEEKLTKRTHQYKEQVWLIVVIH